MHQPTLASPCAIASTTWNRVAGSTSSPSQERGISRRNSRASCKRVEHVVGNAALAFDAVAGAVDQRDQLARPADQLGGAPLPIRGAGLIRKAIQHPATPASRGSS